MIQDGNYYSAMLGWHYLNLFYFDGKQFYHVYTDLVRSMLLI